MAEEIPLSKEEAAAWRLASLACVGTAEVLAKFSGWLMTVLGAALTFFVANHESVSRIIGIPYIRASLFLFGISMLLGLLAQWLTVPVKAGLAFSAEALDLRSKKLDPAAFIAAYASLLVPPYRWYFYRRLASAHDTDALTPILAPAKLSQYQALLVIVQYLLAIAVVITLAAGIKV